MAQVTADEFPAGARQVRGLARVRMGLEAIDNVGGGDLPKLSVL